MLILIVLYTRHLIPFNCLHVLSSDHDYLMVEIFLGYYSVATCSDNDGLFILLTFGLFKYFSNSQKCLN